VDAQYTLPVGSDTKEAPNFAVMLFACHTNYLYPEDMVGLEVSWRKLP